jgi:tRNA(Ile)-lysidine synthase TilS/MesJ
MASTVSPGIVFRKRVVDEVTRGVTDRADYEKISREIRYSMYQTVQAEFGKGDDENGVIFGHHKGDVQENVISNVFRGISPLSLSGMSEASYANGVLIWRPLLDHCKDEIFEFARRLGAPGVSCATNSCHCWSRSMAKVVCEICHPSQRHQTRRGTLSPRTYIDPLLRRSVAFRVAWW